MQWALQVCAGGLTNATALSQPVRKVYPRDSNTGSPEFLKVRAAWLWRLDISRDIILKMIFTDQGAARKWRSVQASIPDISDISYFIFLCPQSHLFSSLYVFLWHSWQVHHFCGDQLWLWLEPPWTSLIGNARTASSKSGKKLQLFCVLFSQQCLEGNVNNWLLFIHLNCFIASS